MNAEWQTTNDVYELGQILVQQGLWNERLWRRFHCACYRRVWDLIGDADVRQAIELAEAYCDDRCSLDELLVAHQTMTKAADIAWEKVYALRESPDTPDAIWPVSKEVDNAWLVYLAAEGGKAVTQRQFTATNLTAIASSLFAWATARKQALAENSTNEHPSRDAVIARWEANSDAEEARQATLLRALVAAGVT